MAVLVTGGAGYIGSVTVEALLESGHEIVVLDNLSRGHRDALNPQIIFYKGDIGDRQLVRMIAREHQLDACIHFAAFAYVGESVVSPQLYFENNVEQGVALLGTLAESGVRCVIFSSSCATYGEPLVLPLDEKHPQNPTNPYGWSKLMLERVLEAYERAGMLRFVALRYFNAAGATPKHGERHTPETHLIPNVLAAAEGLLPSVSVFGHDYPTADGTAIRDYIHVSDLANAHLLALDYLIDGGSSEFINLGNGRGYSVLEVIETARAVTGRPISIRNEEARPGDPSQLVAGAEKARRILGWRPSRAELATIIGSAWEWREQHRHLIDQPLK